MEIMLDKKQIWTIFLFEFKMSHKVAETSHNINNAFGSGTANIQYSRTFAKVTRALKMRNIVAGRWKLTATNWEDHRSWSSYNYMRNCQRTQRHPFYSHSAFEANLKSEKAC